MSWGYIYIKSRGKPADEQEFDAAVYTNVLFTGAAPETASEPNWFKAEGGGEGGVKADINAEEGQLTVLQDQRDTKFLNC